MNKKNIEVFYRVLSNPYLNNKNFKKIFNDVKKNIDINGYDQCNYTPLMNSICHSLNYLNTTKRIELILQNGADPNKRGGYGMYSPILLAISNKEMSTHIVKLLIKYKCTINEESIWKCAMGGRIDVLDILEYNFDGKICDIRDEKGRNLLDYAKLFDRNDKFLSELEKRLK